VRLSLLRSSDRRHQDHDCRDSSAPIGRLSTLGVVNGYSEKIEAPPTGDAVPLLAVLAKLGGEAAGLVPTLETSGTIET
jgi:hypothetical protein